MQNDLILKEFKDLKSAVSLLKASVKKFKPYKQKKIYTPDELEYYDSLSFRFEKCVELTLNFYKGLEIFLHSKGSDTLRDRLLNMQRLNLIDDIDFWMEARLLRNKIAHSYLPEQLKDLYNEVINRSKKIFEYVNRTEKYVEKIVE
jgi:hypothetical protein